MTGFHQLMSSGYEAGPGLPEGESFHGVGQVASKDAKPSLSVMIDILMPVSGRMMTLPVRSIGNPAALAAAFSAADSADIVEDAVFPQHRAM
jgi:hypothetical protein